MQDANILVIGLGLIGGSLAMAVKREHEDCLIAGYDIDEEKQQLALSMGVIDQKVDKITEGAPQADVIVIAAPVVNTETIMDTLLTCSLRKHVIVTDVGSTKQAIMRKAMAFAERQITFIGGHPLAGSHKSGVGAANPRLFENAFYVLIQQNDIEERKDIERLQSYLRGTKAKFIQVTAAEHDRIVGVISHFPHIVAASLVHQLSGMSSDNVDIRHLAAGGFRDITRIASSSPKMWHDVLLHNRDVLLELMVQWEQEMSDVKQMVQTMDSDRIFQYFSTAKAYRDELPQKEKGALPSVYELYVDVPDYPGIIAQVTDVIAKAGISLTNISIIEMREGVIGALRVTFRSEDDRQEAIELLAAENYHTYVSE